MWLCRVLAASRVQSLPDVLEVNRIIQIAPAQGTSMSKKRTVELEYVCSTRIMSDFSDRCKERRSAGKTYKCFPDVQASTGGVITRTCLLVEQAAEGRVSTLTVTQRLCCRLNIV